MTKNTKLMGRAQLYYSPDVLHAGGKYPASNKKQIEELKKKKAAIVEQLDEISQTCDLMSRYVEAQTDLRHTHWLISDLRLAKRSGSRKRLRGTEYEKAPDLRAGLAKEKKKVDSLEQELRDLRSEIKRSSADNGLLQQLKKVEGKLAAARKPVSRRKKAKNVNPKKKKSRKRSIRTISGGGVSPR